jgi:hypothetical protein
MSNKNMLSLNLKKNLKMDTDDDLYWYTYRDLSSGDNVGHSNATQANIDIWEVYKIHQG